MTASLIRHFCDSQTGRRGGNPGGGRGRRWQPSSQVQFDLNSQQSEEKLCFATCVFRRSVEFFSIPKQEWVTLADMTIARCKPWTNNQAQEIETATIFFCRQDGARPCCHQRDPHGLCPDPKTDSFVLINDHQPKIKQIKDVSNTLSVGPSVWPHRKGATTAGTRPQNCIKLSKIFHWSF